MGHLQYVIQYAWNCYIKMTRAKTLLLRSSRSSEGHIRMNDYDVLWNTVIEFDLGEYMNTV